MTTVFGKIYICVKVIGILGLLAWVLVTCCSWIPFGPFCPPDIVPHMPPHFPDPNTGDGIASVRK